jgi:hypothetical protein
MNLSQIFSQFGISSKTAMDITMFLVIVFFSFIFGVLIGRYKLITILINIYVAMAVMGAVSTKILADYSYRLLLFFAIIIGLTILSKEMFELPISAGGKGFFLRVFVMSFLEIMLMLISVFEIMPKKIALSYISSNSYGYFTAENFVLFWTIIPLVFLFTIHKKISR